MKTIAEIRLDNLLLIQSQFKTVAELAELADISAVYLSQIKARTPDNKTGTPKQMGDKVARKIELAIKVPLGWMDMQHGENDAQPSMVEPLHPLKTGELFLMYVDSNELRLLTSYRKNPKFQPIFDSIAQVITEKP